MEYPVSTKLGFLFAFSLGVVFLYVWETAPWLAAKYSEIL